MLHLAAIILLLLLPLSAVPLRVLTIGDSLSEEYAYEIIFSAPESDPGDANTHNWIELLTLFRSEQVSHGSYASTAGSYGDLRNAGHRWNFGIPATTVYNWFNLITTDELFPLPDDDFPLNQFYFETRASLISELSSADVVLIMLGGNDLKKDYNDLFNNSEPDKFFTRILNRLNAIHSWLREQKPGIPIVLCTTPDVGATPHLSAIYSDPDKVTTTRAKIAQFNQDIIALADSKTGTTIARIDRLTERIFEQHPFHLNGTIFTIEGSAENPPDHVFCHDNFHPSTVGQALIANEIIAALNSLTGRDITPFNDREILQRALALDPDQPYHHWIANYPISATGMNDDPDFDGFPNLVEMALASAPNQFSTPLTGAWHPSSGITWSTDPSADLYLKLIAQESTNLIEWTPIPAERLIKSNGQTTARPAPDASSSFSRLHAVPR